MSFSFCELAVAYLQNLLMMFPLISDHPLRERIQLVECNLKQNAIEANDQDTIDTGVSHLQSCFYFFVVS